MSEMRSTQPKNSRNSMSKVELKENVRKEALRKFGYTSRGCHLFSKCRIMLLHPDSDRCQKFRLEVLVE